MAKNVFILGAGFSAPAGAPVIYNFIPEAKSLYLDNAYELKETGYYDFFDRVFAYKEALKNVNATFAEDFNDIEKLYSYSDFECRYIDPSPARLDIRRSLIFMIVKTIDMLTARKQRHSCPLSPNSNLHKEYLRLKDPIPNYDMYDMFALLLSGRYNLEPSASSVITFNYDIVLDNACLKQGIFPDYHLPIPEARKPNLKILKLHGSANWITCANPVCENREKLIDVKHGTKFLHGLMSNTCPKCKNQTLMPLIVPPSWDKTQFKDILGNIWNEAGKEIREARRIFLIGYSLPDADLYFKYLLYTTLSFNKNDPEIYIISNGGNEEVRARLGRLFSRNFYERQVRDAYSHFGTEQFIVDQLRAVPNKWFK